MVFVPEELEKKSAMISVAAAPIKTTTTNNRISDAETERWLFEEQLYESKLCCMLYGADNTGKSGVCLEYLTSTEVKAGEKMIVIDLDGGCEPVLREYHQDKLVNIRVRNPYSTMIDESGEVSTDYKQTLNRIRFTVKWIAEHYKQYKIRAVVFDGLSTLLTYAEYIMRIEKNVDADGGVQQRYWIIRMRIFTELLEQIRALPIDKFFIAHEDFIQNADKEMSSAKRKANQLVFQKVRFERFDTPTEIIFRATIDKSKTDSSLEGRTIDFLQIDKETKKVMWYGRKVMELLRGNKI